MKQADLVFWPSPIFREMGFLHALHAAGARARRLSEPFEAFTKAVKVSMTSTRTFSSRSLKRLTSAGASVVIRLWSVLV